MTAGFLVDKFAECGKCGSTNIRRREMITSYSYNASTVYECVDCGAVLEDVRNKFDSLVGETWTQKHLKKTPFEGADKKDLEEMSVAVELLMEHPEAAEYIKKFQADLKFALAAGK